ncbi:MAG: hypothetical protein AB1425_01450 [Actinomycetota bacterium]
MEELLRRFRNEDGTPNIGLIVAGFIAVCVIIGVAWQVAGPGGAEGEERGEQGASPGGATGEPGGHDPLGRASFTEQDRAEVEKTVERFTLAAYGYEGADPKEYRRGVEELVTPAFWSSPGGMDVEESVDLVEDGGVASTAETYLTTKVRGFRAEEESIEGVTGTVYMVQEIYPLRQLVYAERELELVPEGEGWRVSYAGEWIESSDSPEEVELAPYRGEEIPREERQEMEQAAERYVKAMYAYPGTDVEEYRAGVREAVSGPEFFKSPGAERVAEQIDFVEQQAQTEYPQTVSELYLQGFEPKEMMEDGQVEGVLYSNDVGATDSPWAELVRLKEVGGEWKVSYAGGVIDGLSYEQWEVVEERLNEQEGEDLFEEELTMDSSG